MEGSVARKSLKELVAGCGDRARVEVEKVAGGREFTPQIVLAAARRLEDTLEGSHWNRAVGRRIKAYPRLAARLRRIGYLFLAAEKKVSAR